MNHLKTEKKKNDLGRCEKLFLHVPSRTSWLSQLIRVSTPEKDDLKMTSSQRWGQSLTYAAQSHNNRSFLDRMMICGFNFQAGAREREN